MSWLNEQRDCLREFLRSGSFRRVLRFCTIGLLVFTVLGAVAGTMAPDAVIELFEEFMDQVQEAGVIDENGNMSVFSLMLNNWRAMLVSALYGFIPFLFLPVVSLFANGAMLGMLAAFYHANNLPMLAFFAGIVPHGIFELPALVISIACGVYLCRSMCRVILKSPNREPMVEVCSDLLRVMLLVVLPLVVAAAFIECYITPVVMEFVVYV
ncbi:MAG: stage II sporulation protein M [Oscillospiraceae bacterium]|nr:stage II sporulation protein M [Oscillospiraceae bacterium]